MAMALDCRNLSKNFRSLPCTQVISYIAVVVKFDIE